MPAFELATDIRAVADQQAELLLWSGTEESELRSSLDPWATALGHLPPSAIDLLRVATAVLIADRRRPRPRSWTRSIRVIIHLLDTAPWSQAFPILIEMLTFMSGDAWEVELLSDAKGRPGPGSHASVDRAGQVALFSGGLDSFCGAVISLATTADAESSVIFLSHRDRATAVTHAQDRAFTWLQSQFGDLVDREIVTLTQTTKVTEPSSRTRSFLYLAEGIATAVGRGANTLVVPENGFMSTNPPLRIDRGGTLSTRSTHPYTLHLFGRLIDALDLPVRIANPYVSMTKGELVSAAKHALPAGDLATGAALTLSCGKLDSRFYKGGNPNWNCGLCYPCIVRRAGMAAAGLDDVTPYAATELEGTSLAQLVDRRADDIAAVRWKLTEGFDADMLVAAGRYPPEFDIDEATELCRRSLEEIRLVPLPS